LHHPFRLAEPAQATRPRNSLARYQNSPPGAGTVPGMLALLLLGASLPTDEQPAGKK